LNYIEGFISLFHLEYFIKKYYVQLLQHFKWEFLKTLTVCLLPYQDLHIFTDVQTIFQGVIALFVLEYFIKNFVRSSYIINGVSTKLCRFAYSHIKIYISLQQNEFGGGRHLFLC